MRFFLEPKRNKILDKFLLALCAAVLSGNVRGQLFVSNENSGSISEYSLSGTPINTSFISRLNQPRGLAIVGNNLFEVNDSGNIGEYSLSGTTVNNKYASGLSSPTVLAASGSTLFVATFTPGVGNQIVKIASGTSSVFANLGLFSDISGMAVDSIGDLFVSEGGYSQIEKISPDGTTITTFVAAAPGFILTDPDGLAFDSSGNLDVVDGGPGQVKSFSSAGAYLGVLAQGNIIEGGDLAFDSLGQIYVSCGNGNIEKYSATGTYLGLFANPGQGALNSIVIVPTPEPSAVTLLVLGLPLLFLFRQFRMPCSQPCDDPL
jgi:hypothetical protein